MCKPDSRLPNDTGFRLEGRVYGKDEALQFLKTSMGFSEVEALEYLNSLNQE